MEEQEAGASACGEVADVGDDAVETDIMDEQVQTKTRLLGSGDPLI